MTRKEQINLYLKERNIPITSLEANSIIEGIDWADANPNLYNDEKYHTVKVSCLDELNRKAASYDTFLDKACKLLEKMIEEVTYYDTLEGAFVQHYDKMEFIEDFRKAMEK